MPPRRRWLPALRRLPRLGYLLVPLLMSLLGGCAVGPEYARPSVPDPASWKEGVASAGATNLQTRWWTLFEDPELDALESQALEANQDLRRSMARVSEARAAVRGAASELYPVLSAEAGHSWNRSSEDVANAPRTDPNYRHYFHQVGLSYEIDAWGRVRRSLEAAKADFVATEADAQVVRLTLTADLAQNYFLLRSLDHERRVTEASRALRQDTAELQETRQRAGLINEMDVTRARTELATVEGDLHALARARAQVEHALAILCGKPPAEFAVPPLATAPEAPTIPPGLPSTLLQRRPDVFAAEQRMRAECARIGIAEAAFFPTLKITGFAGGATADLSSLVNWQSRVASLGPSVHFPIFEGGRNRANLKAAKARFEQSVAAYQATLLNAFREVEDALSDMSTLTAQGLAVRRALEAARETATLANERYQRGLTSYLDVVDAQRAALQAERQEAQLTGERALSTCRLAKALGGGWTAPAPELAYNSVPVEATHE